MTILFEPSWWRLIATLDLRLNPCAWVLLDPAKLRAVIVHKAGPSQSEYQERIAHCSRSIYPCKRLAVVCVIESCAQRSSTEIQALLQSKMVCITTFTGSTRATDGWALMERDFKAQPMAIASQWPAALVTWPKTLRGFASKVGNTRQRSAL